MTKCSCVSRRDVIGAAVFGTASLYAGPSLLLTSATALASDHMRDTPGATRQRMAAAEGSFFRPYRSQHSSVADIVTWVTVDLGSVRPIDGVRLYPMKGHLVAGDGFPQRFRIDCSVNANFSAPQLIVDWSGKDYPDPEDRIVEFGTKRAKPVMAKYVRIVVTKLSKKKRPPFLQFLPAEKLAEMENLLSFYLFSLAKIEVLSDGLDIAAGRSVVVDPAYGNSIDAQQLTAPRPQGEGLITDNPSNVTAFETWRPPHRPARAPRSGVLLREGLFKTAFQHSLLFYEVSDEYFSCCPVVEPKPLFF